MKNSNSIVRTVTVRVTTNSKKPRIDVIAADFLHVWVREKAKDGEANNAVMILISKYYNVAKTSVRIARGEKSRIKTLEIT